MKNQISEELLTQIHTKLNKNQFDIAGHAQQDILKQGYNWSKRFIITRLKNGKIYAGKTLYPDKKDRHYGYYCIDKYWSIKLLSHKLILIRFIIKNNILIIHLSHVNKSSKEGKIYYNS